MSERALHIRQREALIRARVIDVHAHAVLDQTMGALGDFGPELGGQEGDQPWFRVGDYRLDGVRYRGSPFMDPSLRIQRMDAAGIDFQLLSPNPLTYLHHIDADSAASFCRTHNDALAEVVAAHPERFGALAAVPIQEPRLAVEELVRCVQSGFFGACIGTDSRYPLHAAEMDVFYDACVWLDVPLFLHPAPAGIDGPVADPSLRHFDLDVVVGFAAQETTAVGLLIFGGVLHRHPGLDVCLSHGAGALGYLAPRLALAARKRPWAPDWLRADGAFEGLLHRLWMDNHVGSEASESLLMQTVNDAHLVFGTNFAGWDAPADLAAHRPSPKLADNARRLLRVGRP
ncbi:MAG: amidohydrolase family protein [Burkholderiaceae bacterium]